MNLTQAVEICRELEPIVSKLGFHVGLTGGCLYKEGERKDADIIFYPHNGGSSTKAGRNRVVRAVCRKYGLSGPVQGSEHHYYGEGSRVVVLQDEFQELRLDLFFLS